MFTTRIFIRKSGAYWEQKQFAERVLCRCRIKFCSQYLVALKNNAINNQHFYSIKPILIIINYVC